MAKKGTSRSVRLSTYPHHFNHNKPKPKPTYSNPQGRLYVRTVNGVITTRTDNTEILSAVAP